MATDLATFRIRFPEFSDSVEFPDVRVQLFLDDAITYIGTDEARWCSKYDLAHAYLTAHLLQKATFTEAGDSSANVGPVTSKSAGGVSVSRGASIKDRADQDDFYMTTSYGQQFIVIRNGCFIGVVIANSL